MTQLNVMRHFPQCKVTNITANKARENGSPVSTTGHITSTLFINY